MCSIFVENMVKFNFVYQSTNIQFFAKNFQKQEKYYLVIIKK